MPKRLQISFLAVFVVALNAHGAVTSDSSISGAVGDARGVVTIGGVRASIGATLAPGNSVVTGSDSAARLVVRGSEFTMHADTQVSLPLTSQGIDLQRGTLLVKEQPAGKVRVAFPGAFVVIKGESGSGALTEVATVGTTSRITVEQGLAEIHAAGAPMLLHAGQWARLEAVGSTPRVTDQSGASTGSGSQAGKGDGTDIVVNSNAKGTTVCNITANSNGKAAEVTVTDTNGTQKKNLKSGFCALFPLGGGAAVALSAAASTSAISGLSAATVVATTAVAGAAIGISTGVVVGIAAAGATGLSLGLVAATGGFSSTPASSGP